MGDFSSDIVRDTPPSLAGASYGGQCPLRLAKARFAPLTRASSDTVRAYLVC